jgi:hypothetical protein
VSGSRLLQTRRNVSKSGDCFLPEQLPFDEQFIIISHPLQCLGAIPVFALGYLFQQNTANNLLIINAHF